MKLTFENHSDELQAHFENAEKYMNFNKLCVDAFRGNMVQGYDLGKANEIIDTKIRRDIFGLPDNPTDVQVKRAMRNESKMTAAFEIIEDVIEDTLVSGWQADPFFNKLVEVKNNRLGQKNSFYFPDKTIITIAKINNGHHDMIRQRLGEGTESSVETSSIGAKIYMSMSRYLQGVEDWAKMISMITVALTRYVNTMLHQEFLVAGKSLPEQQWYTGGKLEAANHDAFVKLISDVELATGSQAMIVGTKVALSQLKNLGAATWLQGEAALTDLYRTGRIGDFEGTPMCELPQAFAENDTTRYLEDDKNIYILPQNMDKPIKFYWEGDTTITETSDQAAHQDKSKDYELQATCGCAVLTNQRFGTWVIG